MPYYPASPGLYPPDNSVTDAKLADMPEATVKGRVLGAGTGDPTNLTGAQVAALLPAGSINAIAPLSYRNILGRNGGFEVWQRGAGGSAAIAYAIGEQKYGPDGWYFYSGSQAMTLWQPTGLSAQSRYSCAVHRNNGQTGAALYQLEFPLDSDEIVPMRSVIVTLSFIASAGANFSAVGQLINVVFVVGTGALPGRFTGGGITGFTKLIDTSQALTPAPTRYTFTTSVIVPANTTQASVVFNATPTGTAGVSDLFVIDDVQLEIGSVATPFERRPFESELAACQRHYEKTFDYGRAPAQATVDYKGALATHHAATGTTGADVCWRYATRKRVAPTITTFNPSQANANFRNLANTTDFAANLLVAVGEMGVTFTTGGVVPNNDAGIIHMTADAGI